MQTSQIYGPTLREIPAEAELVSHQFMLRAGLMRKSTAGVYTYLPLGLIVLHKIMAIIREEMTSAQGQEILLPIMQPAELWHETKRWDDYGDEMFKLVDRHKRQFCLGPTHEEVITALVRADVRSYRQLPLRLYQIQNKYRDEIRPRFGVIRGREFIMKDLYSFDIDEQGLHESYQAMFQAYTRIFERCGLSALPVEADSGAIGGDATHEFMVLADSGEADIVYCSACDYAANVERAEFVAPDVHTITNDSANSDCIQELDTPHTTTIDELTSALEISADKLIKTMIYLADKKPIAALIRGDYTLNEVKLQKALDCQELVLADAQTTEQVTSAPVGFAGPVGLSIPIIVDYSVMTMSHGITGANQRDLHLANVTLGRDYQATAIADLREAKSGDPCPHCSEALESARGIEVGQVFKLGTKYSEPLEATFLDENGKKRPMIMGCYGIGVSRTMAAIIEQNHDSDGICWPINVAPYHVIIVPVNYKDEAQKNVADAVYRQFLDAKVAVVLDDRHERPGVKFKDADLIGYPIRITVGPRLLPEKQVEVTIRHNKEQLTIHLDEVLEKVSRLLYG